MIIRYLGLALLLFALTSTARAEPIVLECREAAHPESPYTFITIIVDESNRSITPIDCIPCLNGTLTVLHLDSTLVEFTVKYRVDGSTWHVKIFADGTWRSEDDSSERALEAQAQQPHQCSNNSFYDPLCGGRLATEDYPPPFDGGQCQKKPSVLR